MGIFCFIPSSWFLFACFVAVQCSFFFEREGQRTRQGGGYEVGLPSLCAPSFHLSC